jgi:serine protease Do
MKLMNSAVACALAALLATGLPAVAKDLSPLDLARQLNEAFIQVADKASSSVVVIEVTEKIAAKDQNDPDSGSWWDVLPPGARRYFQDHNPHNHKPAHPRLEHGEGSGIVVSPDGYILTNNHVVENADKITVRLKDGSQFDADVKGVDPESDIAIIKINATALTPAKLGDSDASRVGEFVLAIGAPFELSYSVTVGHISAKGRTFEDLSTGYADQDFLQTDASINPGNSGGPLVNLYGEVIAINTMIEGMNTGIGFAIPINLAKRVMAHLLNEGKYTRSWIGIRIGDLAEDHDYQGLDGKLAPDTQQGVIVEEIQPEGPAARSDLRPGDVIIAIDGNPVKTSRELKDEIAAKTPGHQVILDVVRGPRHLSVKLTPETLPEEKELASNDQPSAGEIEAAPLGLTVQGLTKGLATQYGIDQTSGVIVTSVEQDSVAEDNGLKPGDVITEIDRKSISTPRQFRDALKTANLKRGMMVIVITDGASRFVVLRDTPQ